MNSPTTIKLTFLSPGNMLNFTESCTFSEQTSPLEVVLELSLHLSLNSDETAGPSALNT